MQASVSIAPRVLALVFLGGGIGSSLRYLVSEWLGSTARATSMPWGTLAVNVTGSFALGWLVARSLAPAGVSESTRALVMIGLLGGYTTFSAFSVETLAMLQAGAAARALSYVTLSALGALAAAAAGFAAGRAFP